MPHVISSVNFIEIGQVVFEYGQVKVSNPLKLIPNRHSYMKKMHKTMKRVPAQRKRHKPLKPLVVNNYHLIAT